MKRPSFLLFITLFFYAGCAALGHSPEPLNVEKLSPGQIRDVKELLQTLEPFIRSKDRAGELPSLTFDELESTLKGHQKSLLRHFLKLKGSDAGVTIPFHGFSIGERELVQVAGQKINVLGKITEIPPQFLSPQVYQAYRFMMQSMNREIGKRLFVESGYRSSAYQLYLFIYYLSNHGYSIRETAKWVALPGYSEHGDPEHLALDFINGEGINGEKNTVDFEVLPEYQWLLKNASRFGFALSYPKNAGEGITFEPWHWRYDGHKKMSMAG